MVSKTQDHLLHFLDLIVGACTVLMGRLDLILGLILSVLLNRHGPPKQGVFFRDFLVVRLEQRQGRFDGGFISLERLNNRRLLRNQAIQILLDRTISGIRSLTFN
jgi:regulator of sirC expression with transglutaminase-like and TPR domain